VDGRTLSRKVLEALIKMRGVRQFGSDPRDIVRANRTRDGSSSQCHWRSPARPKFAFRRLEEKASQVSDFSITLPEWPQHELLAYEKDSARVLCDRASLDTIRAHTSKITLSRLTITLNQLQNRTVTRVGGLHCWCAERYPKPAYAMSRSRTVRFCN